MTVYRISLVLLLLAAATLSACGDGGLDGSYVAVFGSQKRTFSLEPGELTVTCKMTPCTVQTSSCQCTCNCTSCTRTVTCEKGCINTCDTMCATKCLDDKSCGGSMISASGNCPAQKTACKGSGLDFEAASNPGSDAGYFLRFVANKLEDQSSQTVSFDYGKDGINYKVEVGFPSSDQSSTAGYKYTYGSFLRTDNSTTYNSQCVLAVDQSLGEGARSYSGTLDCIMLWAADKSKDYVSAPLNSHVDLSASFACEARDTSQ